MTQLRSLRFLCALALLAVPSVGTASLVSAFDSGDDGWTVNSSQGTAGVGNFAWDSTFGNPGGAVRATDFGDQGGWWFVAPGAWSGDWTAYLGGTISFDVFAVSGQDKTTNPPVEAVVFLLQDGGRLRSKESAGAMLDQWVSVEIALSADQFNLTNSGNASFEAALGHVTGLVIPGDFVYKQQDSTWLDNVRVTAAPEPGSAMLLLVGLAGLALVRPATGAVRRGRQ